MEYNSFNAEAERQLVRYNVYLEKRRNESKSLQNVFRYMKSRRRTSQAWRMKNSKQLPPIRQSFLPRSSKKYMQAQVISYNSDKRLLFRPWTPTFGFTVTKSLLSGQFLAPPLSTLCHQLLQRRLSNKSRDLSGTFLTQLHPSGGPKKSRMETRFRYPIPKKGPFGDPNNYWPTSITSALGRAFEKLIKRHLLRHLEDKDIIPKQQFSFRKGNSVSILVREDT